MILERTSVGLDVHARSVAAAALDAATGEVVRQRLAASSEVVLDWLGSLPGPVAVTCEAGPTGFGLYRAITAAGIRCEVAAPSKLTRPTGDRVKTDARDALLLAQLLRVGQITAVRVPTVTEEAARDLVRAREDVTWSGPARMSVATARREDTLRSKPAPAKKRCRRLTRTDGISPCPLDGRPYISVERHARRA